VSQARVGLVVVSHSRALASAAVELAREMLAGRASRIEEAAGLDDGTFGTDAVHIAEAMTRADAGAGAVVLMDLGSAVLSAELALDLIDPALRERVVLCAAPLVEGLSVAAVAAATGAGRHEVAAEALAALAGKQSHLGAQPHTAGSLAGDGAVRGTFEVNWPQGLHARPAAVLVQAVRDLGVQVELRNLTLGAAPVPAGSLSRVATLGARQGHLVEVTARGPAARAAVDRILALAATGFGDLAPPGAGPPSPPAEAARPAGPLPAVPGVAVGPAWVVHTPSTGAGPGDEAAGGGQWPRLQAALADAEKEVRRTREHAARVAGESQARIFDAHLLLLDDPDLLDRARSAIDRGSDARSAWAAAVADVEARLAGTPDDYLRARAADVRAVGDQVLQRLGGRPGALPPSPPGPAVLVAPDLTPAQAATLDPDRVVAVVLAGGSPTAHSAILTRALGIPTVVAAGPAVLAVTPGTLLAVDGGTGELVVDPDAGARAAFERRAHALDERRSAARRHSRSAAVTRDGVEVHVGANVSSLDDARRAADAGADLAGLVRTEFLFLDRALPPSVEEQADAYRAIAQAMPGSRIVVRTLDVGGDKRLDYLPAPAEANPFLGVRGIRLALARPQLLADQLLAVVRVAHDHPVDVMFPMVSTLAELLAARRALADAVRAEGRGTPAGMRVGVMVEVPALALKAPALAAHVDFLSIGTNDLTQYALAAERGNEAVAAIADPLDPGVLGLVAAAARARTTVAVCGELAADERATGLLLGLGVRELSVVPAAVAQLKQAVRDVDLSQAEELAQAALAAPDAGGVRALLGDPGEYRARSGS
jgi:phosphoenolpyruvate-protein phosphotransferase/dihydroxyacetone kinase phosphotransfer subunit